MVVGSVLEEISSNIGDIVILGIYIESWVLTGKPVTYWLALKKRINA